MKLPRSWKTSILLQADLAINEPQIAKIQKGCYFTTLVDGEKLDSIFYNLTLQKTII